MNKQRTHHRINLTKSAIILLQSLNNKQQAGMSTLCHDVSYMSKIG
uniref:Uncharacterized protein n=1 Tax=Arundo donax TaxID=35708 RepID=A0A0A9DMG5_ARUDO